MKITAKPPQPVIADTKPNPTRRSFSETLKQSPVSEYVDALFQDEKRLEHKMKKVARGGQMSNVELLETQALLYRYTQEVDLASRVVDKTCNGLKQLMSIQV